MKALLIAAILATAAMATAAVPAMASSGSGGRLDAIASGRIYDKHLTPKLNRRFYLDAHGERQLLQALRRGRVTIEDVPPAQRDYFLRRLGERY